MMELTSAEPLELDSVRFGPFFLNLSTRRLRHNATLVPLKPKEAELLVLLAARLGKPVSRDEIMENLWVPHKATDYALSQTVYRLRRALEAFDPTSDYVRTVPGIGYHLVSPARSNGDSDGLLFRDPAFQPYQLAMFRLKQQTQPKLVESIGFFEDALALNPEFVPALTGLAQVYTNAGIRSFIEPLTAYYQAKQALGKAVALEPNNSDAFTLLSLLVLFFDADLTRARDAAEQAVALAPQSPKARNAMVWQLLAREDYSAALLEADRALRTNPSDAHATALLGIVLYMLRRYDEASVYFQESLQFSPTYAPALFYYACALYMKERYDDALALLNRMPGTEMASRELAVRGCIAIRQRRETVRKHFEARLNALPFRADVSIASMHVTADDLDAAGNALSQALETREPGLFLTAIDPLYEPVWHAHPALIATIREGRRPRCDRCATPMAQNGQPLYALHLCDRCSA
jgi:DNA-binding winged helix-turn-helix (wHTH) protein/Tfp pilus assembly protein PilF